MLLRRKPQTERPVIEREVYIAFRQRNRQSAIDLAGQHFLSLPNVVLLLHQWEDLGWVEAFIPLMVAGTEASRKWWRLTTLGQQELAKLYPF